MSVNAIKNYVGGGWTAPASRDELPVTNPATAEVIAKVPLSSKSDIDRAASAAAEALPAWRRTPPGDRIQPLFKLKQLLEENLEDLARTITDECGKTREESVGELRRGIENVEVACGIPMMLQGQISEDIASGIDELLLRQPVGVVGIVTPFNFPGMIPLWFLPYAIACGNTLVLKPSEKVPLTMHKIFQLLERTGLPKGVANLVNGSRETVEALVDHPEVRAIRLVGSTPVARAVFARAAANGKRAQCQGGAKNPVIVLPDADMEAATRIIADSAFGCAGQRCLATSVAITVGDARGLFREQIADIASARVVGYGQDAGVEMDPVISTESQQRIEMLIGKGASEGADVMVDGRRPAIPGYERGYFVKPTILDNVTPGGEIAKTEIFGPVLSLMHAETIDDAIAMVNAGTYGNQACLFT